MTQSQNTILSTLTVVVVEDNSDLAQLLKKSLQSQAINVTVITRGDQVIKYLKNNRVDLIFLDIILPGKDGYQVLKEIKNNDNTKQIPVIILTNLSNTEQVERGINLGAADFLVKTNVTLEEIKKLMHKHIVFHSARKNLHKD